jgi:predicted P-loop ATPase
MGSVNDAEFLSDTTGNRRYLCFTVEDIKYEHTVSMDNVYAQAYYLLTTYRDENGKAFKYWFDRNDIEKIEENNAAYLRMSIEEELILKYFDRPTDMTRAKEMTPSDIILHINQKQKDLKLDAIGSMKRIGQAMTKHHFVKKSKGASKPYLVVVKNVESNSNHIHTPDIEEDIAYGNIDPSQFGKIGKVIS